jgi:hypothetical protein
MQNLSSVFFIRISLRGRSAPQCLQLTITVYLFFSLCVANPKFSWNYCAFELCPLFGILNYREQNVSDTGSVSVFRWGGRGVVCYVLGSSLLYAILRTCPSPLMRKGPAVCPTYRLMRVRTRQSMYAKLFCVRSRRPWCVRNQPFLQRIE